MHPIPYRSRSHLPTSSLIHALGLALGAALTLLGWTAPLALGQTLYAEPFDAEETARVIARQGADTVLRFIDYSDFQVGESSFSLSEAPGKLADSLPTRGVLFQANLTDGAAAAINLLAAQSPEGDPVTVSGTYQVSFDVFVNVADPIPGGGTEQMLWGVGTSQGPLHGRHLRTDAALEGVWGWLAGENGYSAEDSVVFAGAAERERKADGDSAELFNEAFTTPGPFADMAARTWIRVTIQVFSDVVRVSYNGVLFHEIEVTPAETEGIPMVGYEDAFGSLSDAPDFQWGLIDNFVVESIVEPALAVREQTPFEVVTLPGGTSTATFGLTNKREQALTLTEATFDGPGAELFSVRSTLPLTFQPGESQSLQVEFTPGTLTGKQAATLELLTDDPDTPPITLDLEAFRFGELLARFPLDDTGNPPQDASGNATSAVYQEFRFVPGYGQPSLVGGGGTSVRFTDDHPSGTGNWMQADVLHTPDVSLSLWIQPEEGLGTHVIFNRTDTATFVDNDGIYGLTLDPDGTLIVRIRDQEVLASTPGAIEPGETYHVVFTHRDDDGFANDTAVRSRLYIDGEMVAEALGSATVGFGDYPADAAATDLHIGSRIAAGSGYAGILDEIQIYRVELEPRQVEQLFTVPEASARFDNPNLFLSSGGEFGSVDPGSSVSRTLTLANSGDSETLTISRSALTGQDASHFSLSAIPASLAPGESVSLTLTFDPGERLGGFSASLEIESNDESQALLTLPLKARVPNPSGLLAHYPLDETEGTLLEDASGNGRQALLRTENGGSVRYGEEALAAGSSLYLQGGDESVVALVEIPAEAALPALPTYTVSMWFQLDPADHDTGSVLFSQGDTLAGASALALLVTPADAPLQWIVTQDQSVATSAELIRSGIPYHLVVSHVDSDPEAEGADALKFYLNGELVETLDQPAAAIVSKPNTPFLFGGIPGASGMVGRLDDLQLYSRDLATDEVRFLFENPGRALGPEDPNPGLDTDGDGLTDQEEIALGTDPQRPDSDGDGLSDGEEIAAQTDPLDRASVLRIIEVNRQETGTRLRWSSQPGVRYVLESSADLQTFTVIAQGVPAEPGETTTHLDANAPADRAFYRLRVE